MREVLLRLVCSLGYRHFSARTPNRFLSAGGKMWILGPRPSGRCKAPDSFAGQALRTGGALLIGAGVEWCAGGIIAGEQTALIADAQSAVGELVDGYWAAYEMDAVAGGGQLQDQIFEGDRVVVADGALMFARQYQLQLDSRQFDELAFGLGRLDREAAIEVGDEVLLEIAIGRRVIGNAVMPEFLRQPSLDGAEGTLAAAAGLR